VQHDEQWHQVRRDQHERQLRHWPGRHLPGGARGKGGTQTPDAHRDDQVQDPEQVPDHENAADRKAGSADKGAGDPRGGHPDGDVPQAGRRYFDEFLRSPEGIATNVLSARLRALCEQGLVEKTPDPSDQRRYTYRLSDDGLRLGELLGDIAAWGLKYLPGTKIMGGIKPAQR